MGGFGNQQSQYSQTPQYQSYGDSSAGTPTAGVAASKQPSYDSYSSYGNTFAQPSFGGQKSDLYSGHASHASQPQVRRLRRHVSFVCPCGCNVGFWLSDLVLFSSLCLWLRKLECESEIQCAAWILSIEHLHNIHVHATCSVPWCTVLPVCSHCLTAVSPLCCHYFAIACIAP